MSCSKREIKQLAVSRKVSLLLCALLLEFSHATSLGQSVPNFQNDVLPVMTKVGCNSGSCHGAASGKNGFKLSLRGYDPEADYQVLTRQALGRRVVKTEPAHSLILLKPTLAISHGGGKRFEVRSPEYEIIANWIAAGTPPPSTADPIVEGIVVEPSAAFLQPGEQVQLLVKARYSDGSEREVTRWVKFSSTSESVALVDNDGRVKTQSYGEAAILLWYSSRVSFARIAVPFPNALDGAIFEKARRNNYIDDLILKKLRELRIAPSQLTTDGEFVRRIYLDTLGVLPTPKEVEEFLADSRSDKRLRLIDQLLERPEFVDYWSYKWSDLLLVTSRKLQRNAMRSYSSWIRKSVLENKPWDGFVRELITANGSTLENGAANFFVIHDDPFDLAETVSDAFLGMSVACARCHNHPMEKWTQNDYYGMVSLFSRVALKSRGAMTAALTKGDDVTVFSTVTREVIHPRLGRPMPPRPLDGESLNLDSSKDRRSHFAEWLTSPLNPYFARAVVNRVWANFMGRGLVEPVDDLRTVNPASNEELFVALTQDFVKHRFDIKHLIRTILNSATYQLSSNTIETNARDDRYYSHYLIRRLPAEVILDTISQVTGVPEEFEGYPLGTRALQLPDTKVVSYFLTSFGRPPRITTCACERQSKSNITQALHLLNGDTLDRKLRLKGNIVDQLLSENPSKKDLVEKLYELTFSRGPTPEEFEEVAPVIDPGDRETVEDLLWALMTSREFLYNR